jgi:hypothetical protein
VPKEVYETVYPLYRKARERVSRGEWVRVNAA